MEFITIASLIFRLFGLVKWAEAFESKRQQKKQAQEEANVPLSQAEEVDYWKHNRE